MKKRAIALFLIVSCFALLFVSQGDAGWLDKIIKRMMREGVDRMDDKWDDAHAAKMGYEAYVLTPKFYSGSTNLPDVDLDFTVDDAEGVEKDVRDGVYGPTAEMLGKDYLDIVGTSRSPAERKNNTIKRVDKYKLEAMSKFAAYEAKAKGIKDFISVDVEIKSPTGYVYEQTLDVLGKKSEVLADNLALRVLLSEALALKVAVTGEIGLLGTASYANYVKKNIENRIEIYDMVYRAR